MLVICVPEVGLESVCEDQWSNGVFFCHGLTHCETVLDSLLRDKVSRPLANVVLASSETTTRQHYTAVMGPNIKPLSKSHK